MQSTRLQKTNYRDPKRWNTVSVPDRVAERAYTKRHVNNDGCWVSAYSVGSHGYAQVGWALPKSERSPGQAKSRMVLAHRASWTHVNGQVPIGMTLDHLCKNRRCVNPAHLRLLSNYENARRNDGTNWAFGTCRNGHPDSNLREVSRTAKSGRKYMGLTCRICEQESRDNWARRNPEKVASISESYKERSRENSRAWYQANKQLTIDRAKAWKERQRKMKIGSQGEDG